MSLSQGRYKNIRRIIRECKPRTILEIGTWNGTHAAQMIHEASAYHDVENIVYFGFDLFEDFDMSETEHCPKKPAKYREVAHKLWSTKAQIVLHKGNTLETLHEFVDKNFIDIDFIFMDGGHSLETIDSDFQAISKLLKPKTRVLVDDCYVGVHSVGTYSLYTKLCSVSFYAVTLLQPIDTTNTGFSNQMFELQLEEA